jgi:hypothetical protein
LERERVVLLGLQVILEKPPTRESHLMWWEHILTDYRGGEVGYYFTVDFEWIWLQMSQIILEYPYDGMDYRHDPDMVLPPREI